MGYIYKVINKVNNKVYIGQTTRTIEQRWKQHLQSARAGESYKFYYAINKYGSENFYVEEIEQCPDISLDEREKYWIDYYDSYKNGYNSTIGGDGNAKIPSQTFYDLWDKGLSVGEIANKLGYSNNAVHNRLMGYENFSNSESIERGNREKATNSKKWQLESICQYDLDGKLIKIYPSMTQASQETGIQKNSIWLVVNKKEHSYTAGGFLWAREGEEIRFPSNKSRPVYKKAVDQFDLEGNYIRTFESCNQAAKAVSEKGRSSGITKVCEGKGKTAYGYKWKYHEKDS